MQSVAGFGQLCLFFFTSQQNFELSPNLTAAMVLLSEDF
jgi:hypothetical protein